MASSLELAFKWLVDNYGKISAFFLGAISVVGVGWKWLSRAVRAIRVSDDLCRLFGRRPADDIQRLLDIASRGVSELQVRSRIVETNLRIGVYICEPVEGKCTWANEFLSESFGLDAASVLGYGWLLAVRTEDRARIRGEWIDAIKNDTPYDTAYVIVNQRTHKEQKVYTRAYPVCDEKGKVSYYVGCTQNVTLRKRDSERILELEKAIDEIKSQVSHDSKETKTDEGL